LLSETDGIISYDTTDFITDISSNTNSTTAPTTGAVVTYVTNSINALDSTPAVTDDAAAAAYVTGVTEVDGVLTAVSQSLFISNIAGNTSSIIAPTTAAVVTYVTNAIDALDSDSSVTDEATAAAYVTGVTLSNGQLSVLSSSLFINDLTNLTNESEIIAPTSAAVLDYIDNFAGTANIETLGTISTGEWNGTLIGVGYGGTGTDVAPTQYGIIYADSTTAYASTAAGTDG